MVEGKHIHTAEQEKEPAGEPPPVRSRLAARTGFGDKTLWDVLQLVIVPLALAAIGFFFSLQQDRRQDAIEDKRAASEQKIEEQRAQDAALQAYLDEMSSLLLTNGSLRESEEGSEVRTLARARTITVLGRLDPKRKTAVMQFLDEADLIQRVEGGAPIISLRGANLSDANLSNADLRKADLTDAELNDADLSGALLSGALLSGALLSGALLSGANLREAELIFANLRNAELIFANLRNAELIFANMSFANLSGGANLSCAILSDANLSGADLSGADLSDADLAGVRRVTQGQLDQAKTLKGATMPNGQRVPQGQLDPVKTIKPGATMPNGQKYEEGCKAQQPY